MSEKKAYDLKVLGEKLKGRGLDLAEESVKLLVEETFDWLEESATLSENPYDDVALVVYPKAKELILKQADKIDGEEG